MEWYIIETEKDIENLQLVYGNFMDSKLVSFHLETGNYVDEELTGYEYNNNIFTMLFQREDIHPFSIEIVFEYMRRLNFISPVMNENWSSEILYGKIAKNSKYIYWTNWKNFNPCNEEHLSYNDFFLVEACKVKWRIVS